MALVDWCGKRRRSSTAAVASAAHSYVTEGSTVPLDAYKHSHDADDTAYLLQRADVYSSETRWSTPFWQRRRTAQLSAEQLLNDQLLDA